MTESFAGMFTPETHKKSVRRVGTAVVVVDSSKAKNASTNASIWTSLATHEHHADEQKQIAIAVHYRNDTCKLITIPLENLEIYNAVVCTNQNFEVNGR